MTPLKDVNILTQKNIVVNEIKAKILYLGLTYDNVLNIIFVVVQILRWIHAVR